MPKKRRSGGRTGSSSGRDGAVQCGKCGRMVPRGKAKRISRRLNLVDPQIGKELHEMGTIMPSRVVSKWYCVSCAVHQHTVSIRSKDDRHDKDRL